MGILGQLSAGVGRFRVAAWWKRVPARYESNLSEVTFEAGQPSVVLRVTSDNSRGEEGTRRETMDRSGVEVSVPPKGSGVEAPPSTERHFQLDN